jgi:hypothetical protein
MEMFSIANSWIPSSDFRHLSRGLVSAVIDGLPLGFVTAGERFRLRVFRLAEGQMSKPENNKISTCFPTKTKHANYIKRIVG